MRTRPALGHVAVMSGLPLHGSKASSDADLRSVSSDRHLSLPHAEAPDHLWTIMNPHGAGRGVHEPRAGQPAPATGTLRRRVTSSQREWSTGSSSSCWPARHATVACLQSHAKLGVRAAEALPAQVLPPVQRSALQSGKLGCTCCLDPQ